MRLGLRHGHMRSFRTHVSVRGSEQPPPLARHIDQSGLARYIEKTRRKIDANSFSARREMDFSLIRRLMA